MKAVDFEGRNMIMAPPPGCEPGTINPLPVLSDGERFVSVWELSDEDIERIIRDRKIYVAILGGSLPPIDLSTEPMFDITFRFNVGDRVFCKVFIPGKEENPEVNGVIEEDRGTFYINTGEYRFPMGYARQLTLLPKQLADA